MRKLAVAVVALSFGIAFAAHPGSKVDYEVVGISADSKSIYFKKTWVAPPMGEEWLAVYDAATGKLKTSQPISRSCMGCPGEMRPERGIDVVLKIEATHGKPVDTTVLKLKGTPNEDVARIEITSAAGHTQVFTGKDVEVKVFTKIEGKLPLAGLSVDKPATAFFQAELTVTAGKDSWTTKTRFHADLVQDFFNGNLTIWKNLWVHGVAVTPDRNAIGLVFADKPFVIRRQKTK